MVTMAKYHTYEHNPNRYFSTWELLIVFSEHSTFNIKTTSMDLRSYTKQELALIFISDNRWVSLSNGELEMRNVVSLHCDSERESHTDLTDSLSLQATGILIWSLNGRTPKESKIREICEIRV